MNFNFLAQVAPDSIWAKPNGSVALYTLIAIGLVIGFGLLFGLMQMPSQFRKYVVATVTFFSGLYWVLFYVWPVPIDRKPGQLPNNAIESMGFWLKDAKSTVVSVTNIFTAFLLGLGVYSLLRIHGGRIAKGNKDSFFSATLLASMVIMVIIGYADWVTRIGGNGAKLDNRDNWTFINFAKDFLFDGLLQQMDAAMFSVIAFYILSAAYRAFRIRSIEATILLATAVLVMLSLMGAVSFLFDGAVNNMAGGHDGTGGHGFLLNFQLTTIAGWIKDTFQTSSLRAIGFGVGIGALAMGLRIWLSLEKMGGNA